MNHIMHSFLISGLAGFTTLIGALVIFIKSDKRNDVICISLAFASGVMICISVLDLIPTAFSYINNTYNIIPSILIVTIFIIIGVIISFSISKVIPKKNDANKELFRTGILSMIILMLHNIPEGIATFITSMNDISFGIYIAIAISFHNIPEGISIAVPIYYSTGSKLKAFFYTFIAGTSELLGAFIAYKFISQYMTDLMLSLLFAVIGGLMLHIVLSELIPSAYRYGSVNKILKFAIYAGILMLLCHYFLH